MRHRSGWSTRSRQQGAVLYIALILLMILTIIGVGSDGDSSLWRLEQVGAPTFSAPEELVPDVENMQVLYGVDPSGTQTVIATGLSFPSAMTLGPDGAVYVSNFGFGVPPTGAGQILRITVPS